MPNQAPEQNFDYHDTFAHGLEEQRIALGESDDETENEPSSAELAAMGLVMLAVIAVPVAVIASVIFTVVKLIR